VPLYVLFQDIAGIRPLTPGFEQIAIRPQLADLPDLDLTAHTPRGPIQFTARALDGGGHRVLITIPEGCQAELLVPATCQPKLEALSPDHPLGLKRFRLVAGRLNTLEVP
jgi:hypothetical protein